MITAVFFKLLQVPSPEDNVFFNRFLFVCKFEIETENLPRCAQNERKMHTIDN